MKKSFLQSTSAASTLVLLRRSSSDQQGMEKNLPRWATSLQPLIPQFSFHGVTGGEAEGGEGMVMDTLVKMSSELHGELQTANKPQPEHQQRRRAHLWLMARLQLSWPWAAHKEGAGASPWLCDTAKAISPRQTAQLVGPRGVCSTEPHVLPVLPQICALLLQCQPSAPSPAQGDTEPSQILHKHALSSTLTHTQHGHGARVPKNSSRAQKIEITSACNGQLTGSLPVTA